MTNGSACFSWALESTDCAVWPVTPTQLAPEPAKATGTMSWRSMFIARVETPSVPLPMRPTLATATVCEGFTSTVKGARASPLARARFCNVCSAFVMGVEVTSAA